MFRTRFLIFLFYFTLFSPVTPNISAVLSDSTPIIEPNICETPNFKAPVIVNSTPINNSTTPQTETNDTINSIDASPPPSNASSIEKESLPTLNNTQEQQSPTTPVKEENHSMSAKERAKQERKATKKLLKELSVCKTILEELEVCFNCLDFVDKKLDFYLFFILL